MTKLELVTREVLRIVTQEHRLITLDNATETPLTAMRFNTISGRHEIECFFGIEFEQEQVDAWTTVQNIIDDVMNLWTSPVTDAAPTATQRVLDPTFMTRPGRLDPPTEADRATIGKTLNDYATESHGDNMQWWLDRDGNKLDRNKGELLCLIHSEVSEAMEGERKNLMDDKLPNRRMAEVELVDALIRIFDYAGAFGYDLEGAYQEKRAFNKQRADHKREARDQVNGKKW